MRSLFQFRIWLGTKNILKNCQIRNTGSYKLSTQYLCDSMLSVGVRVRVKVRERECVSVCVCSVRVGEKKRDKLKMNLDLFFSKKGREKLKVTLSHATSRGNSSL